MQCAGILYNNNTGNGMGSEYGSLWGNAIYKLPN